MRNFLLGFLSASTLALAGAVYISYVEPDLLLNGRQIHIDLSCPDCNKCSPDCNCDKCECTNQECQINPTVALN